MTFQRTTTTQGTGCAVTSTALSCGLGTLAGGASTTVASVVRPTLAGDLSNTASVAATEPDPTAANNSATATTVVNAAPAAPAPSEVDLSAATSAGGPVIASVPVRLPASGIVAVPVTLLGSGATLQIATGTAVTNADGTPFAGRLFPPAPRADLGVVPEPFLFSSSAGPGIRFGVAAASQAGASAGPLTLTLPVPAGMSPSAARVVRVDPATGAITTLVGTPDPTGTKVGFASATLGTFGLAEVLELSRISSAPSLTADIPVRVPHSGCVHLPSRSAARAHRSPSPPGRPS